MQVILHQVILRGQQKLLDLGQNGLKVCVIDDAGDQTIGITTTSLSDYGCVVGNGVTVAVSDVVIPGAGTTSTFTGYLKGIITGVSTDATGAAGGSTFDVKLTHRVTGAGGTASMLKLDRLFRRNKIWIN